MPLQTGGNTPIQPQNDVMQGMTSEQQREIKTGLIVTKLRRYWRIWSLIQFVLAFGCELAKGEGLVGSLGIAVLTTAITYFVVLYLFLYLLVGRTVQFFLWLKDLFGGDKDTRL